MLFLDSVCDTSAVLEIIMFADKLLGVVFFVVPMLLIVMVIVDLTKGVASNEDEMRKRLNVTVRRIVLAVILFLMPNVITLFNGLMDNTLFSECMSHANAMYIKDVKLKEATERAAINNITSSDSTTSLSSGKKKITKSKKRKTNTEDNSIASKFDVTLDGKLPDGDEYYPLDGKNKKGKLLTYLEIDGKFLSDDEQDEMKKFIKAAVRSSDNWNDRVALAAWSLTYGLYKKGLRLHYFKGNRTWGTSDTVNPDGTCSSIGWCKNWGRFASASSVSWGCSSYGYINAGNDCGKSKHYTGMGCDGFARWAIKTSRCGYDLIAGKYQSDRDAFPRSYDYAKGKPGDMLRASIGMAHFRVFLKYDKKKKAVLTAEESGWYGPAGLFLHYYPVSELKAGGYEVISMEKGYAKYCRKSGLKK